MIFDDLHQQHFLVLLLQIQHILLDPEEKENHLLFIRLALRYRKKLILPLSTKDKPRPLHLESILLNMRPSHLPLHCD